MTVRTESPPAPIHDPPPDARAMREACSGFGTGVVVISTRDGEAVHAMTANAFMSISLDPPLIAISLAHTAKMLEIVRRVGRFCVSVLSEDMMDHAWHFAGKPRLEGDAIFESFNDMPTMQGAATRFIADIHDDVLAGDHSVIFGRVLALDHNGQARPLLFHHGKFKIIGE